MIPIFEDAQWQMTPGERAALEGVLSQLGPSLALEVGTFQGGSLRRIAAHSREVHSFDMELPPGHASYTNVHFHTGDSHVLLPQWLDALKHEGRRIDFALVDGDHTTAGVRADIKDILDSGLLDGVMLFHDTMNSKCRKGVRQAGFGKRPDLQYLDLDFVPGHLGTYGSGFSAQLWGGIGIAVISEAPTAPGFSEFASKGPEQDAVYKPYALMRPAAELLGLPVRVSRLFRSALGRVRSQRAR